MSHWLLEAAILGVCCEAAVALLQDSKPMRLLLWDNITLTDPVRWWEECLVELTHCGECASFWPALVGAFVLEDGWRAAATCAIAWRLATLLHLVRWKVVPDED